MLVFCDFLTPRISYSFDCCAALAGSPPWSITTDRQEFNRETGPRINYSNQQLEGSYLQITPQGLLQESGIRPQDPAAGRQDGMPVIFANKGMLGFDLPAAVFYLLSRYEEYLPHETDQHGRFDHRHSLAFQLGWIDQPLVNQWIQWLKNRLQFLYPDLSFEQQKFQVLPTYDVDMAFSYLHKGYWRNAAGALRDLAQGRFSAIYERLQVLSARRADPFDSFQRLEPLAEKYGWPARYFLLVGTRRNAYDKNLSPFHPAMKDLIGRVSRQFDWGLHPSWASGDNPSGIAQEKQLLESLTNQPVKASRQHYLRLTLPETYRRLLAAGIDADYSMGYAGINGFRASVASPFYWYDLSGERPTPLKVYPFCYMDATALYYQKLSPAEALQESLRLAATVQKVKGLFCGIWHNDLLGTAAVARGWWEAHLQLLAALKNRQ